MKKIVLLAFVVVLLMVGSSSSWALTEKEQKAVVARARQDVITGVKYDSNEYGLKANNGYDVPKNKGACTDVVIRALRAIGYDLRIRMGQSKNKKQKNIYHRRCRNQIPYFRRHAKALAKDPTSKDWQPGDIVYWDLNGRGLLHVGIVSDASGLSGLPMVIHNIPPGAQESDDLASWKIIAHFRL